MSGIFTSKLNELLGSFTDTPFASQLPDWARYELSRSWYLEHQDDLGEITVPASFLVALMRADEDDYETALALRQSVVSSLLDHVESAWREAYAEEHLTTVDTYV